MLLRKIATHHDVLKDYCSPTCCFERLSFASVPHKIIHERTSQKLSFANMPLRKIVVYEDVTKYLFIAMAEYFCVKTRRNMPFVNTAVYKDLFVQSRTRSYQTTLYDFLCILVDVCGATVNCNPFDAMVCDGCITLRFFVFCTWRHNCTRKIFFTWLTMDFLITSYATHDHNCLRTDHIFVLLNVVYNGLCRNVIAIA